MFFVEALLAYALADAFTGIYHAATDKGFNIRSQVILFQQHHTSPAGMVPDFRPVILGIPLALIALLGWHPVFFLALGISISACQVPHYWAHHRRGRIVRALQQARIIISPRAHAVHHRHFDRNFCTISGWNNFWLNWLLNPREVAR